MFAVGGALSVGVDTHSLASLQPGPPCGGPSALDGMRRDVLRGARWFSGSSGVVVQQ